MNKHSPTERKHILLVENSKTARHSIVSEVTKYGYAVKSVATGKEALEALHKSHYDLVIMDLLLPELNGYEAAELIKQSKPDNNTPIFAYTSSDSETDRRRCQQAGITEYILKSEHHTQLLDKIKAILAPIP